MLDGDRDLKQRLGELERELRQKDRDIQLAAVAGNELVSQVAHLQQQLAQTHEIQVETHGRMGGNGIMEEYVLVDETTPTKKLGIVRTPTRKRLAQSKPATPQAIRKMRLHHDTTTSTASLSHEPIQEYRSDEATDLNAKLEHMRRHYHVQLETHQDQIYQAEMHLQDQQETIDRLNRRIEKLVLDLGRVKEVNRILVEREAADVPSVGGSDGVSSDSVMGDIRGMLTRRKLNTGKQDETASLSKVFEFDSGAAETAMTPDPVSNTGITTDVEVKELKKTIEDLTEQVTRLQNENKYLAALIDESKDLVDQLSAPTQSVPIEVPAPMEASARDAAEDVSQNNQGGDFVNAHEQVETINEEFHDLALSSESEQNQRPLSDEITCHPSPRVQLYEVNQPETSDEDDQSEEDQDFEPSHNIHGVSPRLTFDEQRFDTAHRNMTAPALSQVHFIPHRPSSTDSPSKSLSPLVALMRGSIVRQHRMASSQSLLARLWSKDAVKWKRKFIWVNPWLNRIYFVKLPNSRCISDSKRVDGSHGQGLLDEYERADGHPVKSAVLKKWRVSVDDENTMVYVG